MKLKQNGLPVGIRYGWWGSSIFDTMSYDRVGEKVKSGLVTTVKGKVIVCQNGLHAAKVPKVALANLNFGSTLYLVGIWGNIDSPSPEDWKFCGRHRLYIKGIKISGKFYDTLLREASRGMLEFLKQRGFPIYQTPSGLWEVNEDKVPWTIEEIAA